MFLYALRCILPLRKGNAKGLELNTQGFLRSLFF
nr:MAG TPA: ATP adenylyltransferase [Caudoviricetes sp.]